MDALGKFAVTLLAWIADRIPKLAYGLGFWVTKFILCIADVVTQLRRWEPTGEPRRGQGRGFPAIKQRPPRFASPRTSVKSRDR